MIYKSLLILLITIAAVNFSFGQSVIKYEDYDKNNPLMQLETIENPKFEEVRNIYEQHWNNFNIEQPRGWKQYKRWEHFWETRLMPDGTFPEGSKVKNEWNKFLQQTNKISPEVQSKTWEIIGPHTIPEKFNGTRTQGLGRVNVVRFDPQNSHTIWVGTATGGAWRSDDLGETWRTFDYTSFLSIGVSDIAVYPKNSSVVYVATGDDDGTYGTGGNYYSVGLIRTYNGGVTWEATNFSKEMEERFVISRVLIHPEDYNILVVATSSGIFRTQDAGKTWENTFSGTYIKDMEFDLENPDILNATSYSYNGNGAFYRSTDNGRSWNNTGNLNGASRIAITVSPSNPNKVWAVASRAGYSSFHSFLISNNKGASWDPVIDYTVHPNLLGRYKGTGGDELEGQGNYDLAIAVNPTDEEEIYTGGINIWKSTNGGDDFERITNWTGGGDLAFVHADIHDLIFKPGTQHLYTGHDGGIDVSTDLGDKFSNITPGLAITQYYRIGVSKSDENLILGGTQDNGTNMSTSSGFKHIGAGDGMECIVHPTSNEIMFHSLYYGTIKRSLNGGKNFGKAIHASDVSEQGAWISPYVFDPNNPSVMYAGFQNIYKSTSTGALNSWTRVSDIGGNTFRSLAVAPGNSNYVYAATQYELFVSKNAGGSWESIYRASSPITYIAVHPEKPTRFWLSIGGFSDHYKVIEFNDAEQINISGNLPNVPVNTIVYQNNSPDRLYIGTDIGVFVSDYNSAYWEPYGTGMPNVIISELEIFYPTKKLIAGTYGRGMWKTELLDCWIDQPYVEATGETEFCEGDSVKIEAEEGFSKYLWSTGDTERVIYAKEKGSYSVRVFDDNDCYANSEAVHVNVKDTPALKIVNGEEDGFCEGDSIRLNASLGFSTYEWSNGETGRGIYVSEEGVYWVVGNAKNGCDVTSEEILVLEYSKPAKPTIKSYHNMLIVKHPDVLISKAIWYKDNQKIAETESDTLLILDDGLYSVKIIDINGCEAISQEHDITIGVEDEMEYKQLSIYPNPGTGLYKLTIEGTELGLLTIEILDEIGNTIKSQTHKMSSDNEVIDIDIKEFANGIYFIKLTINSQSTLRKIIKN